MATELKRDTFSAEVVQSDLPVLIDFWGPLCKPCLALMPAIDKMEKEYGDKIKVCKVNAAENRMLCIDLKVISLPTFLLYNKGNEIKRLTGEQLTASEIEKAVKEVI